MKKLPLFIAAFGFSVLVQAQSVRPIWSSVKEKEIKPVGERVIIPNKYKTYHISSDLKTMLWSAPDEKDVKLQDSPVMIDLPMPDGTMQQYRVVYSPVMAPELAAQFPDMRTFNVVSVDGSAAYGKLDWTEMGFHAMIRKTGNDIFIDPFCRSNTSDYITYYRSDYEKDPSKILPEVGVKENKNTKKRQSKHNHPRLLQKYGR